MTLLEEQHLRLHVFDKVAATLRLYDTHVSVCDVIEFSSWIITGQVDSRFIDPDPETEQSIKDLAKQVLETEEEATPRDEPEGPGWLHVVKDASQLKLFYENAKPYGIDRFYVGDDVVWVRIAPPDVPEGLKLYDFSGEKPEDFEIGGQVLYWNGYINISGLSVFKRNDFDNADRMLKQGRPEYVIYAYEPKETAQNETSEPEEISNAVGRRIKATSRLDRSIQFLGETGTVTNHNGRPDGVFIIKMDSGTLWAAAPNEFIFIDSNDMPEEGAS